MQICCSIVYYQSIRIIVHMSSENISSFRSRSGLYFHIFAGFWKILSCSVDYSAYNDNVLKQRMVCTNILTGDRTVNLTEF